MNGESAYEPLAVSPPRIARPESHHILPTSGQRPDQVDAPLDVVTVLFNTRRFRSKWSHTENFIRLVAGNPKVRLHVGEVSFRERLPALELPNNVQVHYFQTDHEMFFKENVINLVVQRLPRDWEYVAWMDADVLPARPDWADETIQMLQHHPAVQMWSQMQDLTDQHEIIGWGPSLIWSWLNGGKATVRGGQPYYQGVPMPPGEKRLGPTGLAWAAVRDWWNGMGGLIDFAVVGACDWYMGYALIGELDKALGSAKYYNPNYVKHIKEWARRAEITQWKERPLVKNVGCVPGLYLHYWHGPKTYRRYVTREGIFKRHQFDPDIDLKRDWQGLWQLTSEKPQLLRDLQTYFAQRNEDWPYTG